jgi:WD40 repeat protein
MAIDQDDIMLATGDLSGVVRVWNLTNGSTVAVLRGHKAGTDIDMLAFGNSPDPGQRYLVSAGKDSTIRFWKWWADERAEGAAPRFVRADNAFVLEVPKASDPDRDRCPCKGECRCRVVCTDFSRGGSYFATGNTDASVHLYEIAPSGPILKATLRKHTKQVDSVKFSHCGSRLLSTSHDGTARIWYHTGGRKSTTWLSRDLPVENPSLKGLIVDTGCWTLDDRFIVCAVFEEKDELEYNTIHVWNALTHQRQHVLHKHQMMIVKIIPHPTVPSIVVSAGRDARMIVWDMITGKPLKEFVNKYTADGSNNPCDVLDCCFSPDGQSIAVTDIYGWWSLYGFCDPAQVRQTKVPGTQFFALDDAPVAMDADFNVLDQASQQAPHLIPQMMVTDGGAEIEPMARTMAARMRSTERMLPGRSNQLRRAKQELERYKHTERHGAWKRPGDVHLVPAGPAAGGGGGVGAAFPSQSVLGKRPAGSTRYQERQMREAREPVYVEDSSEEVDESDDANLSDWGQAQVRRSNRAKRQSSRESRSERALRREQSRELSYADLMYSDDEYGYGPGTRRSTRSSAAGAAGERKSNRRGGGGGGDGHAAGVAAVAHRSSSAVNKKTGKSWTDYLPSKWITYVSRCLFWVFFVLEPRRSASDPTYCCCSGSQLASVTVLYLLLIVCGIERSHSYQRRHRLLVWSHHYATGMTSRW